MIAIGSGRTLLVTRAEWGARRPKYTTPINPTFGTSVHWEGPSMPDFSHGACASYVRGIQNYHMDAKGWSDIAYTAVVCPHGYVFEGRWLNNRTGANGTNIGNGTAYAVCFLGGIGDPYTSEAGRAMHDTTTHLRRHGRAGRGVNCHRDWKPTQCPGDVICGRVKSGAYNSDTTAPEPTPTPTDEEYDMIKIVWYVGNRLVGAPDRVVAGYRLISAKGEDGKWYGHTAIHIQDPPRLNLLRFLGHPEVKTGVGSQGQPLEVKDWNAGIAFLNGPFQNV